MHAKANQTYFWVQCIAGRCVSLCTPETRLNTLHMLMYALAWRLSQTIETSRGLEFLPIVDDFVGDCRDQATGFKLHQGGSSNEYCSGHSKEHGHYDFWIVTNTQPRYSMITCSYEVFVQTYTVLSATSDTLALAFRERVNRGIILSLGTLHCQFWVSLCVLVRQRHAEQTKDREKPYGAILFTHLV